MDKLRSQSDRRNHSVISADGKAYEVRNRVTLCRCGQSKNCGRRSDAALPVTVVTCSVQDGCHNHRLPGFICFINDAIRKAVWITPTDVFVRMTGGIEQGIFRECVPNPDDFFHELHAQSGLPGFIPSRRFGDILFNFGSNDHPPAHFGKRERKRALTWSNGMAESGFLRWATSRSSTSFSSVGESGGSSNSSARRTSNCRWPTVNACNSSRTSVKLMM